MSYTEPNWEEMARALPPIDRQAAAYVDTRLQYGEVPRISRRQYRIVLFNSANLAQRERLDKAFPGAAHTGIYNTATHILEVRCSWSTTDLADLPEVWHPEYVAKSRTEALDAIPQNRGFVAIDPELVEMLAEREQRRIARELEESEHARAEQIRAEEFERKKKSHDCFERLWDKEPIYALLLWDVNEWGKTWTPEEKEEYRNSEFKLWYDLVLDAVTVKSKRAAITGLLNYLGESCT